jgi:hypothetical protein
MEIVVVTSILLVCAIPMVHLLTRTGRLQERSSRSTYAHLIARRVFETALGLSRQGLQAIPTHDGFLCAVDNKERGTSPYFQSFGPSLSGVSSAEFPLLVKALSHYRFRFVLKPVTGQETNLSLRNAVLEIHWDPVEGKGPRKMVLQTILSSVPII